MQICISSGHSTKCQGASDIINEVDEATKVVDSVANLLFESGYEVHKFHDTVSTSQDENLNRIVDWHNSQVRDIDVSVHFNAYTHCQEGRGTEVLYTSQQALAAELSAGIADVSGLINRGPKYRDDLFFLNQTACPAVLIEVAFVDSETDVKLYRTYYPLICEAIADILGNGDGLEDEDEDEAEIKPPSGKVLFHATGSCSYFGGPDDMGVSASEDLAFHYEINDANQHLFLPLQPAGTTGLARRLNAKAVSYVACRWDYDVTPKAMLAGPDMALVRAPATGREMIAFPADWGPHEEKTGRAADLSPWLMQALDIETDDIVEVIYPWRGG